MILVLIFPYEFVQHYDGGSYQINAIAYSVFRRHKLTGPMMHESDGNAKRMYESGWSITVFGIKVLDYSYEETEDSG